MQILQVQIFVLWSSSKWWKSYPRRKVITLLCLRIQRKSKFKLLIVHNLRKESSTSWRDVVTQTLFENLARKVPWQNWKRRPTKLNPISISNHHYYLHSNPAAGSIAWVAQPQKFEIYLKYGGKSFSLPLASKVFVIGTL